MSGLCTRLSVVLPLALVAPALGQVNLAGFPKSCTNEQLGGPLFFDFDRDGIDELLHANADHKLDIWEAGGVALPGFPVGTGWHVWNMTPAVGDLDGDGTFEVVTACADYKVYAFGEHGQPVAGFPRSLGSEITAGACLADLDGDGDLEILLQPRGSGGIYALQGDGTILPGWPVRVGIAEGGAQTPAVADIDNDGLPEVVATTQGAGSVLTVVHPDGRPQPGFPIVVVYFVGSPVLADLDRDMDLEIIAPVGGDLYAWHHDGRVVAGFPTDCGNWSICNSPAVGDIDRDGHPEIVFGSQSGDVYVVRHDGTIAPGWPVYSAGSVHATPGLADVDFDGDLEVFVAAPTSGSGGIYAWHDDGTPLAGFPWLVGSAFYGGVTLGDLNDDGKLDVAAGGRAKYLFGWTTEFAHDATRIVHGSYRHNRHNNAVLDLRPADGMLGVTMETASPKAAAGQFVGVSLRIANRSTVPASVQLVLEVEYPEGGRQPLLTRPIVLAPGAAETVRHVYEVPQKGPLGGYRLVAALRDAQDRVLHWDGELLTVTFGSKFGDLNCDGAVNFGDIDPFVLALGGAPGYYARYPQCFWLNADCDQNGAVDFADINPFVKLLGG